MEPPFEELGTQQTYVFISAKVSLRSHIYLFDFFISLCNVETDMIK